MAELRDWIDLRGLTITDLKCAGRFVRIELSDESWIEVDADGAFDEDGMRLRDASALVTA